MKELTHEYIEELRTRLKHAGLKGEPYPDERYDDFTVEDYVNIEDDNGIWCSCGRAGDNRAWALAEVFCAFDPLATELEALRARVAELEAGAES